MLLAHAPAEGSALATSPVDTPGIDLDDATKVRVDSQQRITAIGKELTEYDALDTGVFLYDRELFEALRIAEQRDAHSLTDANRILIERGRLRSVPVGSLLWQDVDTDADLARARADIHRIVNDDA